MPLLSRKSVGVGARGVALGMGSGMLSYGTSLLYSHVSIQGFVMMVLRGMTRHTKLISIVQSDSQMASQLVVVSFFLLCWDVSGAIGLS